MRSSVDSVAKQKKLADKKARELARWEKEKARPKKSVYLVYLILIISLVYITDEVASQIGTLMKTEIANDLFSRYGDSSVGLLDVLGMIAVPFQALAVFYKPLADRFGRKIFLVINTLGMGLGMLLIFLSGNLALYVIGTCIVQFFVPHDMQVVYIMESAPKKRRAKIYSIVKCIATLGIMLVPFLRRFLMENASQWRNVYLIPALVGLITAFVALFFARETDAFIDSRIRWLKKSEEELQKEKEQKNAQNAQGGLLSALRFVFRHKQLKWLFASMALCNTGFFITMNYQVILSYGYAQNAVQSGLFAEMGEQVMDYVSTGAVTRALFLFPVGSALVQLVSGFIGDAKGRRASSIAQSAVCVLSFIGFTAGASFAILPELAGLLCGMCIGSFWANGDAIGLMIGESSPTNLRSSIMSAQFFAMGAGIVVSFAVGIPLMTLLGNGSVAAVAVGLTVPGLIGAIAALTGKVHDTKGMDLDTVTGCEWD